MAAFLRGAVLALAFVGGAAMARADTVTVTFVQTNDLSEMSGGANSGGLARLATVVRDARARGHAYLVHAGNALSPSLLSGLDHGEHMIDLLNQIGVDIFTPGNHEFDFGPEIFRERLAEAQFPVLTSNVLEADGTVPAHVVQELWIEVEGIRIAFYGLTTEQTPVISSPGSVTFLNPITTAVAKAQQLRAAGADLVVAVAHTPFADDLTLFRNRVADLIISGHDEHLMTYYNGAVALTESGSQGEYVIVTTLTIDRTVADGVPTLTWYPDFDIVDTTTVTPDPELADAIAGYESRLDVALAEPIGTTAVALDSRRATVLGGESSMGNLIADAMRAAVDADIAIVNGGAIRGNRLYPAGTELTRADILTELPFNNRTLKLQVTGAQILAALENGFSEIRLSTGRFAQISGMTVEVNGFAAVGNRVLSVSIGGRPLVQSQLYTLATNDFLAAGGDGYTIFRNVPRLIDLPGAQLTTAQVIDHIAALGTVDAAVDGRIVLH